MEVLGISGHFALYCHSLATHSALLQSAEVWSVLEKSRRCPENRTIGLWLVRLIRWGLRWRYEPGRSTNVTSSLEVRNKGQHGVIGTTGPSGVRPRSSDATSAGRRIPQTS